MNFENYYNTLSSHQDEINQINHLCLNITSKGLIMDEMPHVEPYKKFDRALFVGCIIFRTDNVKFFCITVLLLFSPFLRQNKRDGPQRQSN